MNLDFLIPFLYPAAIAATLLSLWWPATGIYYLAFILPLQTLRYQLHDYPFGASIIDVVLAGVIIGILLQRRGELFSDFPVRGILLAFVSYLYVSLWNGAFMLNRGMPITAADPRVSNWKNVAELCLLCFFVFAAIKTERQVRTLLFVLMLSALAVSYDFYEVVHVEDLSHYSFTLRYAGVMGYADVNGLAAFEAQLLLFLAGLQSSKLSRTFRVTIPIIMLSCGYGVIFAFSRGAYVAVAVGIIFLGLVRKRIYLVAGLALFLGANTLLPGAVTDRINGTYTANEGSGGSSLDNSSMERIIMWQDAIELIKSYPLRGTGFDSYRLLHRAPGFGDTHNYYIKILVEEGLLGFLLFMTLQWRMFRVGYDLFRASSNPLYSSIGLGFASCMVVVLVVNFFGDRWSYQQVNGVLWILLGLVCRARVLSKEQDALEAAGSPAEETAQEAVGIGDEALSPA